MPDLAIRQAEPGDAEALFDLAETTIAETDFLLRQPGEGPRSAAAWRTILGLQQTGDGNIMLVADIGVCLVGQCGLYRGEYARNRHTAMIGVAVRQSHVGRGIGKRLLTAAVERARTVGIGRLELTVMVNNDRALRLYRRHGFVVEGQKQGSVKLPGGSVDEIMMARLFED